MRAAVIAAGFALLVAGISPVQLAAQRSVSTSVDGFNGLPWGASHQDIEDKYGSAVRTDTLENGIVVLSYRETLLDLPARTMYALLPDKGLVKGQHMVGLDLDAGDCRGQYSRLRDHVMFTYPLIVPTENSEYPYDLSFCEAVRQGAGVWATQWIDRSTSSIVTVVVEEGSTEVKLIFESGMFLDWLGVSLPPEDEED